MPRVPRSAAASRNSDWLSAEELEVVEDAASRMRGPGFLDVSDRFEIAFPDELVARIAEEAARIVVDRVRTGDGYLDATGAAEFLCCPKSRIYALVSKGALPVERDGSRLLFDREALRAYVRNGGGDAAVTAGTKPRLCEACGRSLEGRREARKTGARHCDAGCRSLRSSSSREASGDPRADPPLVRPMWRITRGP